MRQSKTTKYFLSIFLNFIQATFKAKWGNRKVEALLTMKTSANDKTLRTSKREISFQLKCPVKKNIYNEVVREQIGRSQSYIEVG